MNLEQAVVEGDIECLAPLLVGTPREGRAREVILGEHFFRNWQEFEARAGAFECAAQAVVDGDEPALRELLRQDPGLVAARSARTHRATLLHYCGSNGVEWFRQKTPANIVEIARLLLGAGADVNATASMYSDDRDTALLLAATSIHPVNAGVLEPLVDLLLSRGAALDGGAVNACHANGRPQAARLLAARGADLDLEAAAGLGRLDVVRGLYPGASPEQIRGGFAWACQYGHADTVAHFLHQGVDVGMKVRNHGQTGLHWAACGAHVEIVKLLLARNPPLEAKDDSYGGTPLAWCLWGFRNRGAESEPDRYLEAARLLVAAGAEVPPPLLEAEPDARMREALRR